MSTRRLLVLVLAGIAVVGGVVVATTRDESLPMSAEAEARQAVVELLEADHAIGRLPEDLASRRVEVASGRAQRRAALERIWVPEEISAQAEEWEQGLDAVADDADYAAYVDNRLIVTAWEGARPLGDGVVITFTGHVEYRGHTWRGWSKSPSTSYRVELRRAGESRWRLVEIDEDYLEAP